MFESSAASISRRRPTSSTVSADYVQEMLCTTVAEERDDLGPQQSAVVSFSNSPRSVPGLVWVRAIFAAQNTTRVSALFSFSSYRPHPLGAAGDLGNSSTHVCVLLFDDTFSPRPLPRAENVAVARFFRVSVDTFSPRRSPALRPPRYWWYNDAFRLCFSCPLRIGLLSSPFYWRSSSAS